MDIKELRVGNWVNVGYNIQWNHENYDAYWKGKGDNDAVEPIPLTVDIIANAKEANSESINFWDICTIAELEDNQVTMWYSLCGYTLFPCRYVHQLQNAHFAMTGKELDIPNI